MMNAKQARKALDKNLTTSKGVKSALISIRKSIKERKNYTSFEGGLCKNVSKELTKLGYHVNHYKGMKRIPKHSTVSF